MAIPYRTNSTGLYEHLHVHKGITSLRENYINAWPFHMQAAVSKNREILVTKLAPQMLIVTNLIND
jgi:hypothetical protein